MNAPALATPGASSSFASRIWAWLLAAWAAILGIIPHVLHHVGPLAGAALLVGAAGKVIFAVIGFAASVPLLLRLHHRFRTWLAPAIALVIFAGVFLISTFVIGPLISGGSGGSNRPGIQQPTGHEAHH